VRHDITSQKRLEEISIRDELTGLYNRRYFNEVIQRELKRLRRAKKHLSFIMLDVDHFKFFNDTYGHCEGDRVLKEIGIALQSILHRGSDYAFRMGGEEFGVLFSELDPEHSEAFAKTICETILELKIPHAKNSAGEYVTASLGLLVANLESDIIDENALYTMADEALYQAKAQGRNRVCIHHHGELELF